MTLGSCNLRSSRPAATRLVLPRWGHWLIAPLIHTRIKLAAWARSKIIQGKNSAKETERMQTQNRDRWENQWHREPKPPAAPELTAFTLGASRGRLRRDAELSGPRRLLQDATGSHQGSHRVSTPCWAVTSLTSLCPVQVRARH